jgi:branched-chain amino acid transport system permease protein
MIQQALAGLVAGGAYAGIAVGIVLMYRMLGVLNFAQSGMGALAATVSLYAFRDLGLGVWPSILLAIAAGAALGAALGFLMARYFLESTVVTRSTVTIGFLVMSLAIGTRILDGSAYNFPDAFAGQSVRVLGTGVPLGSIAEAGGAILLAIGLGQFLVRTRVGASLRAMSERPITAQLQGIPVKRLTVLVWAFSGALSTLAVLFVLPTSTTSFPPLAYMTVYALGAALLGLLQSLTVAAVGGVLIGMIQSVVLTTPAGQYAQAVPFVIIILAMVWWSKGDVWAERR